jgi:purine-binding chemotaxis protein CheW
MRRRLGLDPVANDTPRMAIGVESKGESYGLLIDVIGEVLKLPIVGREDNPVNLDPALARVSAGVHRLDDKLVVILDIDRVLDVAPAVEAA